MQKSSQLFVVAALLLIAALVASMPAQARSAIVIGSGESTRAQISAALLVQVLRQSGFKARSQVIDDGVRVSALERGLVQILPEVPVADVAQHFSSALKAGTIVDLGFKQAGKADPQYRKLAWSKTRRRWTSEFKLIKNMTIPEADVLAIIGAVNGGKSVDAAVADWVGQNTSRWAKWKSASRNWMKP